MDATDSILGSLAQKYGVQGYPTIKVFRGKREPTDYNGGRDANGIVAAALKEAQNLVNGRLGGGGGNKKSDGGGKKKDKGGKKKGGSKDAVVTLTDANFDEMVLQSEDAWMVEFYAPVSRCACEGKESYVADVTSYSSLSVSSY